MGLFDFVGDTIDAVVDGAKSVFDYVADTETHSGQDRKTNDLTAASYAIDENLNINRCTPKYDDHNAYAIIASDGTNNYWVLPIPTSLTYDSDYQWSSDTLGHGGAALAGGLGNVATKIINGDAMGAVGSAMDGVIGGAKAFTVEYSRGQIQKFLNNNNLNGETTLKEAERQAGVAYNPNKQLYFNEVDMRDFSVTFSLAPTSREEAEAIRNGFIMLAKRAAPEYKADKFYFEYPDFFKFAVIVNGNDKTHHTMYSRAGLAITQLNLDLAPDAALTWHDDGFPTALQLSISFKESIIPTRQNLSKITIFGRQIK